MSAGPMTIPPPIPNIPASTPAPRPMAMNSITVVARFLLLATAQKVERCKKVSRFASSRNSLLHRLHHLVGEDIDLIQSRVHVGRDANPLEFGVHDRRVDDAVLIEQPGTELHVV